jgi:hypothetical protein
MICRPSKGRSGGIALFWCNGMDVTLKTMSKYFIDFEVGRDEARWRFIDIYVEPRSDKRDVT